ncbi:MAG: hypothetical protein ACLR17_14655 [Enterobacteriaceae bacterium]
MRNCATQFVSCQDAVAALGMRVLGNPAGQIRALFPANPAPSVSVCCGDSFHPQREALSQAQAG